MQQIKNASFTYGKHVGYVFSYLLFTTLLYLILTFTEKLPASLTYIHILFITTLITTFGFLLEKWFQ